MRSQETELQTQLLTLQLENARLNDIVNQIRSANESMDSKNLGLAQQFQTSKFELSSAQTEVSHLRSSMGGINPPKLETQKISSTLKERETLYVARDKMREIDRLILNLGTAEMEAAHIQSLWEDVHCAMNSWSHAEGPTGVGRYHSADGHTHRWKYISVYSTKSLRREGLHQQWTPYGEEQARAAAWELHEIIYKIRGTYQEK